MTDTSQQVDGAVLYADGSFRQNRAGWGLHGYFYRNEPLKQGVGVKQLPTSNGYDLVTLPSTVTPVEYVDGYGNVLVTPTNNSAELQAVIRALAVAEEKGITRLVIRSDSEYVLKNLEKNARVWMRNNWLKADGTLAANAPYWKELIEAEDRWRKAGKELELIWVKGHSLELGNCKADELARAGSGMVAPDCLVFNDPTGYHNAEVECSPLIQRKRLLFNLGVPDTDTEPYYYMYNLGRMHGYGHKQGDTSRDKILKTDLLFGRRISEATFAVYKAAAPDPYIEELKAYHIKAHQKDLVELGVLLLDNAMRPSLFQRIRALKDRALLTHTELGALATPEDELISKTLSPMRLAHQGVQQFAIMRRRLDEYLSGEVGVGVTVLDVTTKFYGEETGSKKGSLKLHKEITNNVPLIEFPITIHGTEVKLKLVLGLDIPNRNQLAKIATLNPSVVLLVVADGPFAYSFSTVFTTAEGSAIYQAPYTQFVLPQPV